MIDGEIHNWSLPWQPNNEEIIDRPGSLKPSYDRFWCFSTDYIREVMHSNSVVTLYYTFKDIPYYHATYPYDRMHKDGSMDFLFFLYFKFFFFLPNAFKYSSCHLWKSCDIYYNKYLLTYIYIYILNILVYIINLNTRKQKNI